MEPRGAFVTLKIAGRLRGCIGMVETHRPLVATIEEMAGAAATGDPRFHPLQAEELPGLEIEISVLTALHPVHSPDAIVVGEHGLVVEKGRRRGLLLPQVASEAGWDVETFLSHTCQKAGLPSGAWRDGDTTIYTFSALVFGQTKRDATPKRSRP
jgi:AmmeMemoRadiSam system protein A